jgi:hypothetical protein
MTKDEALRLALEALQNPWKAGPDGVADAIIAIKAALEANEFNPDWDTQAVLVEEIQRMAKRIEELEAQRTWVGLTDDDLSDIADVATKSGNLYDLRLIIEAKLKEKNT